MSDDDISSAVLANALNKYIALTAKIPEDWNKETEVLHYNRQRRLLSFMENLTRDLHDEDYEEQVEAAEDDYNPWGSQKDRFNYLSEREEALFELLSRKNVLQLTRVQDPTDADPIDPGDVDLSGG